MASNGVITVTNENFQQTVLQSKLPVLVDFWASWCAPCLAIAPHVEALTQRFQGKLIVGKLDVDANQEIAAQYEVRSIPTLLIFKDGKVLDQLVGAVPKAMLEKFVEKALV